MKGNNQQYAFTKITFYLNVSICVDKWLYSYVSLMQHGTELLKINAKWHHCLLTSGADESAFWTGSMSRTIREEPASGNELDFASLICNTGQLVDAVQGHVQPGQNGGKRSLNGNGGAYTLLQVNTLFWWRKCCNYGSWEGHSLCSFWRIFEAWWNGYINTCLILQNTLDVTVTALAVQNKREHPNRVKGFVETGS